MPAHLQDFFIKHSYYGRNCRGTFTNIMYPNDDGDGEKITRGIIEQLIG